MKHFFLFADATTDGAAGGSTNGVDLNQIWNQIVQFFITSGWSLVWFFIALILGVILVKILRKIIHKLFARSKIDHTILDFFEQIIKFTMDLILIIILANIIGINTTSLVTMLGAAGLAVGLAVQDSLSNFANGMILIFTKPFKEGNYVDVAGTSGVIQSVGLIVTTLKTYDNKIITVPNSLITKDVIVNYEASETRRLNMSISIAIGEDFDKVKRVLDNVMRNHPMVLKNPEPYIKLDSFNSSSLTVIYRCYVKTPDYWSAYWDFNELVYKAFRENGINIPYNKLDVRVVSDALNNVD